jgi:hypothetical protein
MTIGYRGLRDHNQEALVDRGASLTGCIVLQGDHDLIQVLCFVTHHDFRRLDWEFDDQEISV